MTKTTPLSARPFAIPKPMQAVAARTRSVKSVPIGLALMQSSFGNQGMLRFISGGVLQRKLAINRPGDVFEQEADRVAQRVMRLPDSAAARAPVVQSDVQSRVQRCAGAKSAGASGQCEERAVQASLQRASATSCEAGTAPPVVHEVLSLPGQPLDADVRSFMEPRFGHDFSGVRVHADAQAAESARAVGALAYAVGNHLVFGEGQYHPGDRSKRGLLAHELVHVVQQGAARTATPGAVSTLARTPALQRFTCEKGKADMTCTDAQDRLLIPRGVAVDRFATDSHVVTATQRAQIADFKATWDEAGSADDVAVHGYASCDGTGDHNLQLSCDRAEAVKTELTKMGVPTTIETFAHGETDEFGPLPVDNHKVIIELVPRPPQTITIPRVRGEATPKQMRADRIPPRVETPVTVIFDGPVNPAAPVTLSVDGGDANNGTATIDGAESQKFRITGAQTVNLKGGTQTTPNFAGALTLVARQRGKVLAASPGFSVSSIPQNLSFTLNHEVTGDFRGFWVDYAWESDSTKKEDLDQASQSERIEKTLVTGSFVGGKVSTGCYFPSDGEGFDKHEVGPVDTLHQAGEVKAQQTFMFKDNRAGATDIPMTNSGYIVHHVVAPKPDSKKQKGKKKGKTVFQVTSSKVATGTSAHDTNPKCPADTIASDAGSGSLTIKQDV